MQEQDQERETITLETQQIENEGSQGFQMYDNVQLDHRCTFGKSDYAAMDSVANN